MMRIFTKSSSLFLRDEGIVQGCKILPQIKADMIWICWKVARNGSNQFLKSIPHINSLNRSSHLGMLQEMPSDVLLHGLLSSMMSGQHSDMDMLDCCEKMPQMNSSNHSLTELMPQMSESCKTCSTMCSSISCSPI